MPFGIVFAQTCVAWRMAALAGGSCPMAGFAQGTQVAWGVVVSIPYMVYLVCWVSA